MELVIDAYILVFSTVPDVLSIVFSIDVLLYILIGTTAGIIIGLLPGLSAMMAMALLLPFTYAFPVEQGLALIISIYVGAIYAGGVTATLINIPGTPSAIVTCLDGFPLAKKGRANETVGTITIASGVGEIIGESFLFLVLPFVATVALLLSDWELALVSFVGVILAGAMAGKVPLKGFIVGILGILIALVGLDPLYASPRFVVTRELVGGFSIVPVLLGLFGITEVLMVLKEKIPYKLLGKPGMAVVNFKELFKNIKNILRSSFVAILIGIIPGTGEGLSPWITYSLAKMDSQNKDEFGKGCMEGVIAAEVANNATSGGALIPTMTLGIPGSGPTALILVALMIYGFRPGPMLLRESPEILTIVVALFIISAIAMMLVGIILSKVFITFLFLPREIILPIIVVLSVLGAWANNFRLFDVSVMIAFGIIGSMLRSKQFPLAPLLIGFLIGGSFELYLRRALLTYQGDLLTMFLKPGGLLIIGFIVFMIFMIRRMQKIIH